MSTTVATARPALNRGAPDAYKALLLLAEEAAAFAATVGVDARTLELVKIRASQLNGCAFCLRMHVREAISLGESSDRLAVVAAWRDTDYFSAQERAALAIAERTTLIGDRVAHTGADASALTSEQTIAVEWVAIGINAFNRVAILSEFAVHGRVASR